MSFFILRRTSSLLTAVLLKAVLLLLAFACFDTSVACGQTVVVCPATQDEALGEFFRAEVWAKVISQECVKCHNSGGDASDSRLVFHDLARATKEEADAWLSENQSRFDEIAKLMEGDESLVLLKVAGELDHGGMQVLSPDSAGYRLLQRYVQRLADPNASLLGSGESAALAASAFEKVVMQDNRLVLRRAVLSLAGRLPTQTEMAAVEAGGLDSVRSVLLEVLKEEAFYGRLREGFNDIFLTLGIDGNPDQNVLSYEHFETSRLWYQSYDLSHIEDERERTQAGYKLANDYRRALLEEPMRLIDHIVREEHPFTEIVTADYIMVSPYSARGYGIFEQVKDRFTNPDDPLEFIPVTLSALKGRNESENQESATGFYPHAGLLSTFQYLSRYPTTETNRNRLRARMYFQHFLGVDVLELAARVGDAAAVSARFANPTMEASECVVCHRSLDPVAGLFQDYFRFDTNFAIYGRRKDGWFADMFPAGFEGEELPAEERWRSLQWLGERTAKDPRFARTMVGHAYFLLTGRKPLLAPKDLNDPLYDARWRAYEEQQAEIDRITERFVQSNYNFKTALIEWVVSDYYRADRLTEVVNEPQLRTQLDDLGVVRMLSPEQLERKIEAVFGQRWGRLTEQTAMLYGGIDSKEVTERASDPSGAMGAIQRTMSNDVACRNVGADFSLPASERVLFGGVEPDVLPGSSEENDLRIKQTIVHLHERILGRFDAIDSPEVDRTYRLFRDIVSDAAARTDIDPREIYHCRKDPEVSIADPHYTIRAWRAVVTYLLRRTEFVYE